jgi:hypothetical protein
MQLVPVPIDYVERTLHHWQRHLSSISERTGFSPDEHLAQVRRGEIIPLLAWDGVRAVALSGARIELNGSGNKVCHLVWCTGEEMGLWFDLLDMIEEWAKEHCGCVGMKATARLGWSRLMKPKGYRTTHVVMEKEF